MLIVDGTLVPTRDHSIAGQSKNYRYSTNHQVVIDTDTRLVAPVGRPLPGNRNDCKAWDLSGAKAAVGKTTVIADGATGAPAWSSHTAANSARANWRHGKGNTTPPTARSRARVERAFAPHEDLEDPPRLPPQGRRCPPRDARHRPPANLNLAG
ncbi:transposase [Streptomyces brasiliscabiei]|uniref:Transposase n=1 Tax=Streptomyces brasiliscabiei TaxID=2736302 RepID=A0ABU8G9H0_9ACTN